MKFTQIVFSNVVPPTKFPDDIVLLLPEKSSLPVNQQHFLIFIPWNDSYLSNIPKQYLDFFKFVLPVLHARTTDVHTAICLGFLDTLLAQFNEPINHKVVAIALILHDSGWSRLSEKEIANSLGVKGLKLNETALGPKEKHAIESEKITREILACYIFEPPLIQEEINLICKAVLYHDKPEVVAGVGESMPLEVQVLVDLDHLWSFSHENFWQDTVRKNVKPVEYLQNLKNDLDSYFVTDEGKKLAKELLVQREKEVDECLTK